MKKLISLVLVAAMILSCITIFADSSASSEMQDVLIKVKEKLDIPDEFTEFTPRTIEQQDKKVYYFMWETKEGGVYTEVSADSEGRILNYYAYDSSLKSDKKLTGWSKGEIIDFAEGFLKKIAPDAFENESDRLIFDEDSWYVNNLSYQLTYRRFRNDIEVKDNNAGISINIYDDKAYVRNASINFNYDAKFNDSADVIADYEAKYEEAFPIELIYKDEYPGYWTKAEEDKDKVALVYRFKDNEAGYILAENGGIVTEDPNNEIYYESANGMLAEDSMATSRKEMLTEQEIKELESVKGLISKADIEKILKSMPYTDFDSSLKNESFAIHKTDEKYYVSASFGNDDGRYISVVADGETGEIQRIYNRAYHDSYKEIKLTDAQKNDANKKIDEFLTAASGEKVKEYNEQKGYDSDYTVTRNFDRMVSGVRYVDDRINVTFDTDLNRITSYSIDYEEKDFPDASAAINETDAYGKMLNIEPLKKIYIQINGVYDVCFTVDEIIMLDAGTGEKYLAGTYEEPAEFKYSDLEGHWAEEAVNRLAEIQIGFEGEKFNPDAAISQFDLLRLFGAGIRYKSYLSQSEDSLYRDLIHEGILTEDEKAPEAQVKREDAFVYMIRLCGWDDVAKLSDIYRVEYADGYLISQDKIGYPAILTGMGVISGDGGMLRPQDAITRAEAMVMLYNYMIK